MLAYIIQWWSWFSYTPGYVGLLWHWRQSYGSQHHYLSIVMTQHYYPCQILIAFLYFLVFHPRFFFWTWSPEVFCCHKNRHIDSLRFDLLVGIFCRTLMIYRLDCWIMASLAAVIVGFLTCAQWQFLFICIRPIWFLLIK